MTITDSFHELLPEGGVADDLENISGGTYTGQLLVLALSKAAADSVTVRHNFGGSGNINLANGKDAVLSGDKDSIFLQLVDGIIWSEIARSERSIADLAGTAEGIPYAIDLYVPGALSAGVLKYKRPAPLGFTIKQVHGYVGTAPAGGACIVDTLVNGSSIFAGQAEMVNIPYQQTYDVSAVKNHAVAAGEYIEFEVEAANGAADLTIHVEGYIAPQTPPT